MLYKLSCWLGGSLFIVGFGGLASVAETDGGFIGLVRAVLLMAAGTFLLYGAAQLEREEAKKRERRRKRKN